jgi:predicted short-subunit dehydrogenase-like oxidoreductase (DUF2520 family)
MAKEPENNVAIIGAGNVGTNLAVALRRKSFRISQVYSRTPGSAETLVKELPGSRRMLLLSELDPALDFVFLTVPDAELEALVLQVLPYRSLRTTYIHCSGSMPLAALSPLGERVGVLYPMQTFSKQRITPFTDVPMFVEGTTESQPRIRVLAHSLSRNVKWLSSDERFQLHIGAVFAANFVNYMIRCAGEVANGIPGLDYKVYMPLIREVVEKLETLTPEQAQTGPARRNEQDLMLAHFEFLRKKDIRLAFVYEMMSRYIMESYRPGTSTP